MNLVDVGILSTVEGVTEFLPISSTAHLILTSHALGIRPDAFLSSFEIAIQLGAIGAVCVIYSKKIVNNKALLSKALVGFIPTGVLGFVFFKQIKNLLSDPIIPVVTLFVGGVAILIIEYYFSKRQKNHPLKTLDQLTYKDSMKVGLIQSLSMVPGVSRAAASIFGGMGLGFKREAAVEFSFLLAIPTMAAATGYDLLKSAKNLTLEELQFISLGTLMSFIVAFIVIRWLLKFVRNHNFVWFGVYRILLSIIYALLFLR